jgi:hypothetical protein
MVYPTLAVNTIAPLQYCTGNKIETRAGWIEI